MKHNLSKQARERIIKLLDIPFINKQELEMLIGSIIKSQEAYVETDRNGKPLKPQIIAEHGTASPSLDSTRKLFEDAGITRPQGWSPCKRELERMFSHLHHRAKHQATTQPTSPTEAELLSLIDTGTITRPADQPITGVLKTRVLKTRANENNTITYIFQL